MFLGAGVVSLMVSVAVDCDPVPTAGGRVPNAMLTDSSSRSESSVVLMEKVLVPSPDAKLTVVLEGEKSPESALPAVMVTGMLSVRSDAGETLTAKLAEPPSSTTRVAGENVTFSRLGMLASPLGDQALSPLLLLERTWTS